MVTQTIIDKLILFLFPNLIIIKTVLIGKVTTRQKVDFNNFCVVCQIELDNMYIFINPKQNAVTSIICLITCGIHIGY